MPARSEPASSQPARSQHARSQPAGSQPAGSPPGPRPTGRLARRDDGIYLLLDRLFAAAAVDVWASLTDPEELATWLGTYTGSPQSGAVKFRFGLPSEIGGAVDGAVDAGPPDAEWAWLSILECEPPRRFLADLGGVHSPGEESAGEGSRRVFFHLAHGTGLTTLTVGERLHASSAAATLSAGAAAEISAEAAMAGPVWDYRLDCLTAARAGEHVPDFGPYIPAQKRYYRELIVPETHL
jgi:uncharacterized protein YndB with AHSA1/START domain